MSDARGDTSAPWIRLAAAVLVGFGLLELAIDLGFVGLIERLDALDPEHGAAELEGLDAYELRERAYRWLDLLGGANLGLAVFRGWAVALTLVAASRRLPPVIAALGFAVATCSTFALIAFQLEPTPPEAESLASWFQLAAGARVVALAGVGTLVLTSTREHPRRPIALAGVTVAVAVELLHLYGTFVVDPAAPPSWWSEPVLGLRPTAWTALLGTIGLGVALWLAGSPTSSDDPRFAAAATRGLRLARATVWWRVGLALGGGALAIAGTTAMQRARQSMIFGGGSGSSSTPWMLKAAPWLGYVELGLGVLMVLGLGAVVLQQRSRLAATLTGLGTMGLLAASMGSFALNRGLHQVVSRFGSTWDGSELRHYGELVQQADPALRWLGLLGMACTLVGLIVLIRVTGGASPIRAIRFLVLAALVTAGWLYGREGLDALGSGVLLLAPLVLGAAIWMLLDLTTFLGEVADALEGERRSMLAER